MAKREIIVDDLDQVTEDAETIEIGYMGKTYEIDLGGKNLDEYHEFMEKYTEVWREVAIEPLPTPAFAQYRAAARSAAPKTAGGRSPEENQAIRDWSAKNPVYDAKGTLLVASERGRIKGEILAAYDAAHAPGAGRVAATPAPMAPEEPEETPTTPDVDVSTIDHENPTDEMVKAWWESRGFKPMENGVMGVHRTQYRKAHSATASA